MILLARGLVRLVSLLLLALLSLTGLAVALACIGTGTELPSLTGLAALLELPALRDSTADWFDQLESPGSVALLSAAGGLAAIALGTLLVAGVLIPRRERLVTLADRNGGTLAARRRPLAQIAGALVEQVRGVTQVKTRVRPHRTTGGRLTVHASRPRPAQSSEVRSAVDDALKDLTDPFKLKARVDVSRRGSRVQ